MKRIPIIICSLIIIFAIGCAKNGGFKRTRSGLQYKIISRENGPQVKRGEFLKLHYTHKVNDSVLATSLNGLPTYAQVDSIGPIYNPAEIFPLLRKGDSAVVVMLADSLFKNQGQLPPNIKKTDKVVLTLRVLDILPTEDALRKDQQTLLEQQKDKEVKVIQQYLASQNISAQKTDKGTFVQIITQGSGPAIDSGKAVHVKYKGQTFAGEVFDTNMDSTFGHTEPYVLVIGQRGAIEGWDDGLRLFKKGDKGRLFIPSMLAYGPSPQPGSLIKPFENLIFDIEIVDVTNAPQQPQMPPQGQVPRQ